jgi:hypothetical protein
LHFSCTKWMWDVYPLEHYAKCVTTALVLMPQSQTINKKSTTWF